MHPALLYFPGDRLSLAELTSARLDGLIMEVGEGYMPADTVEGALARARSVSGLVIPGAALSGPSAAWVHGAGDAPPQRHHVRPWEEKSRRPLSNTRVRAHHVLVPFEELTWIGGVAVVAPTAVAIELALAAHRDPESERWLLGLLAVMPAEAAAAHADISSRGRTPGKRHALELLSGGQEVVTR